MTPTLQQKIEEKVKEFDNLYGSDLWTIQRRRDIDAKEFLWAAFKDIAREAREEVLSQLRPYEWFRSDFEMEEINPHELAERIVIEYANLSGRESENRTYVREAALNVLNKLSNPSSGE